MPVTHPDLVPANACPLPGQPTKPQLAYRIGGITFGLFSASGLRLAVEPSLRHFVVEEVSCDIRIQVAWSDHLEAPQHAPSFQSGGLWSVYKVSSGYQFFFSTPSLGTTPYKAAWFDAEFSSGRVELFRPYFRGDGPVYPLEYPLDELLMIHRLSRGEGVEVHALGIADGTGRGHLFLGHSGAGKSTTARLWDSIPGVHILSDDRIILRVHNGRVWMYGTPWHGDAGVASPGCAPLSRMYLLEHGGNNEMIPLQPGRAAAELFARSFVPYHSAEGLDFALRFLDRVARETPCSVFRFVPDKSAVEAISRA
jgi:hypothetical protein